MSTRSVTKFYKDGKFILALYKQQDGYTESWGKKLKDFIKSGRFVNGFSSGESGVVFNGFGCFILQLVTKFKKGTGEFYAISEKDKESYNYKVEWRTGLGNKIKPNDRIILSVEDCNKKEAKEFYEVIEIKGEGRV